MNNIELQNFIEQRNEYEKIIGFNVIEDCNKIVQVGDYTLDTNDKNEVILSLSKFPRQYSEKSVEKLLKINWESKNSTKKPNIVNAGEIIVLPKGIEHNPCTKNDEEVHVLLFEKLNIAHTGNVEHEKTQTEYTKL